MVKKPTQISNLSSPEFPSLFKHGRVLYLLPSVQRVSVRVDEDVWEKQVELYNQGLEVRRDADFQNTTVSGRDSQPGS